MKLVEEIKNRAKRVMADKNYPLAHALYTKAIEVANHSLTYHFPSDMLNFTLTTPRLASPSRTLST